MQVVWGTLLFSPCVLILAALAALVMIPNKPVAVATAFCLAAPACLSIFCIWCCWRGLVPFTIEILQPVAQVLGEHCGVLLVGIGTTLASLAYMLLAGTAIVGFWSKVSNGQPTGIPSRYDNQNVYYAIYFLVALVLIWGGTVFVNACHVVYCGLFGRWYFGREVSVCQSMQAAVVSFGSICLGSIIVAAMRAVDAVLQQIRRQAGAERQNFAVQCALCVLECLVRCVADIAEALSYFAYVQVALRGFSFIASARATYALCQYRNVRAIIACSLVGSVVGIGSFLCGSAASLVGCWVCARLTPSGASEDDRAFAEGLALGLGVVLGFGVASNVLHALQSGFATICVCWAEDGEKLSDRQTQLHNAFDQRARLQ